MKMGILSRPPAPSRKWVSTGPGFGECGFFEVSTQYWETRMAFPSGNQPRSAASASCAMKLRTVA
jgi:hypothetical protein